MEYRELAQLVKASAEVCGSMLSDPAAAIIVDALNGLDDAAIKHALKTVRESGGRFTLGAIKEAMQTQDGRPGPEEAWAIASQARDENRTLVWTAEMESAYGLARETHREDHVAARVAFREIYLRLVAEARDRGESVHWEPSLGHDVAGRAPALEAAIEMGRLPPSARALAEGTERGGIHKLLPAPSENGKPEPCPEELKSLLAKYKKKPEPEGGDK